MTEPEKPELDLSAEPSTDGKPATESPVVAGAGQTFDELDNSTPLSADGGPTQPRGQSTEDAAEGGPDPTAGS
jgi:hypothetical protein